MQRLRLFIGLFLFITIANTASAQPDMGKMMTDMKTLVTELTEGYSDKVWGKEWDDNKQRRMEKLNKADTYQVIAIRMFEIEEELGTKKMPESWKAERTTWNAKMRAVEGWDQLADGLHSWAEGTKGMLGEEFLANYDAWLGRVNKIRDELADAQGKLDVLSERINLTKEEAKPLFDEIWAGTQNGFADVVMGEIIQIGDKEFYHTRKSFPKTKGTLVEKVNEDDGYVLKYTAAFQAGKYEENAVWLVDELKKMTTEFLPSDFVGKENHSSKYLNSKLWMVEKNSSDFTEVAKAPSVTIGIVKKKDQYVVELVFAEPVFK